MKHTRLEDRIAQYQISKKRKVFFSLLFMVFIGTMLVSAANANGAFTPGVGSLLSLSHREDRLRERLNLPDTNLSLAIEERKKLLSSTVTVQARSKDGKVLDSWSIVLSEKPSWIIFVRSDDDIMHARVSENRILSALESNPFSSLPDAASCTILSTWKDTFDVTRAQTDCIAKPGYFIDRSALAGEIKKALESGTKDMSFEVSMVSPTIENPDTAPRSTLKLLATGHSTFKGSGEGRKTNVRKALTERLHNIIIPDGATFSFNDALGNNISLRNGWKEALTIFEGVNLRLAVGGGICQASTTLYRAVLRAGLPIVEQKNHSLYVTYYEAHGVGQDATVFPGKQDFQFRNDSGGPVLVQAYNDKDEAYVNIYGFDDGRRVTLAGPYFAADKPASFVEVGKVIRANEVAWVRTTQNGEVKTTDLLVAHYNAIPRSLPKKYVATTEETRGGTLHAAASVSLALNTKGQE